ncbi:hypothetical protein NKH72_31540 [Mesorhizobium sp. M0955]|uniref:hypothetical protein n=1 Tax=Mesorhizobium sp. M0955 TaxID=2957033 RepID=UPI003338F268
MEPEDSVSEIARKSWLFAGSDAALAGAAAMSTLIPTARLADVLARIDSTHIAGFLICYRGNEKQANQQAAA